MTTAPTSPKKRRPIKRIIAFSVIIILSVVGFFIYINFNRILSDALQRSFDSSIASDVYELKFERLRLNLLEGTIRVFDVSLLPRDRPLREYAYINSSFRLKTDRITLKNVELMELVRNSRLKLERITIAKPEIQVLFANAKPIFLPFQDSVAVKSQEAQTGKRAIEGFSLHEFQLIDASFRFANAAKQRTFEILNFSISLEDLFINQRPGHDLASFKHVSLSIGEFKGHLQKGPVRSLSFKDYQVGIDSLEVQQTVDTLIFHLADFKTGLKDLDIQTADSIFHVTLQSFNLSYGEKSLKLDNVAFKPNISDAALQAKYRYQHTNVAGSAGSVILTDIDFDSLVYHRALSIGAIAIDKPEVAIFKDNTKPVDKNRIPLYFGQQLSAIRMPLSIREVKVTNINLVNTERKRDSSYAKVNIRRGTALVKNISSRSKKPMTLSADAFINNKVHFNLHLGFSYSKPQFTVDGKFGRFNLTDLNAVIQAYTPAKISAGTADEIAFSGTVFRENSSGTMKFLYHDLKVDLALQNKAKWKSDVIAFAANTIVDSSNPPSADQPPRIVRYQAKRDMNKGFVNIVIKSALAGVKETLLMSKENRKAYNEEKKRMKQNAKK